MKSSRYAGLCLAAFLIVACYDESNLNTTGEPTSIERLRIKDSNTSVVWDIVATPPVHQLDAIRYGVVPERFSQEEPRSGRPRELRKGERLSMMILTHDMVVCQHGTAAGPASFAPDGYLSVHRDGRKFPKWTPQMAADAARCDP